MPASGPRTPNSTDLNPDEVDIGLVLEVFRRRWLVILGVTTLAIAVGARFSLIQTDTYTSTAIVQKLAQSSPLSSVAFDAVGQGLPPDAMASEVELLQSRAVLAPVVRNLGLNLLFSDPEGAQGLSEGASSDSLVAPGSFTLRRVGESLELLDVAGSRLATAGPGEGLNGPGFRIQVPQSLALSDPIELTVIALPDAVDRLRGNLFVSQAEYTSLIRIRYTAASADQAATVANAVADSYFARAASVAREGASRRREFLAEQLASVADSVRQAQAAISDFQRDSRVLNPASEGESLADGLRREELRIRQLRYQQGLLQSLVSGLSDATGGEGIERIVTLSEEMVPGAQTVYSRLRGLQDERQRLIGDRYGYREGSSRVAVLDSLIAGARQELRTLAEESLDLTGTQLAEAQQEAAQIRAQVGQLPGQATAITRLEQTADGVMATFDLLSARFYEAQIAEAVASADVEIVDYATPPSRPDPRNPVLPILLAAMLGIGTGGFGALALEGLNKTVRRSGDAEAATGLPLLGMIPDLGSGADPSRREAPLVVRRGHHGGPAAEAFKSLPAMIRYARSEEPRVIAVVSQGPKEGKSFTAANLALAIAKGGTKTLLLDCDLHRPQVARMFEIPREPGISEYVTGQAGYAQCVREILGYSLWVMPAGGRSPDPAQLLGSPRFRELLDSARSDFDAIVLDTPPVLAVSEVLDLTQLVDGVVMVARAEQTNRFALQEAAERLRKVEAPLLGLVLNDVKAGPGSGAYGGYYYRYYAYDYKPEDNDLRRTRRRKTKT